MNKIIQNAQYLPLPGPAMAIDVLKLMISSTQELVTVLAKENTHVRGFDAWEKTQMEIINVQRDFLQSALDQTFDERRENFRRLFDNLDLALQSEGETAGARVSEVLEAITELAKVSPFKDLKSPELFVQEFLAQGKIIEL